MSVVRLLALVVVATGAYLAAPDQAAAVNFPAAACNGGGCGGWFRSNVTVTWAIDPGFTSQSGCGGTTITSDGGTTLTCVATYPGGTVSATVGVQKDSSPPGVSVSPSRGPDANGWYTAPVPFTAAGDDGASGVASCTSGTYTGPDGGEAKLSASCTDNAGNTGSGSATIKYDGAGPTVTAAAARPPNANGWYNRPVQVTFQGADAGSGLKECSPPVEYKGPDARPAKLVGQCRDNAGHLSAPFTFELRYDGTKPARAKVRTSHRGTAIALSWTKARDVVRSMVLRAPGARGKKPLVVVDGKRTSVVDGKVKPGTRYWYEVRLYDQAGNMATTTVKLNPSVGIMSPTDGSVLKRAPVVDWAAVKKARFYNVQIWRGGTKILTTWPTSTTFTVPASWTFGGKRLRLANGRYKLFIWPAFGTTRSPGYGKLVGQVTFVVRR